jgi:hypothetical protein
LKIEVFGNYILGSSDNYFLKRRLNPGNACYHSVQTPLSKNAKIRISKTIILPVVWNGCNTPSLTLREELRLRAFDYRSLRRKLEQR